MRLFAHGGINRRCGLTRGTAQRWGPAGWGNAEGGHVGRCGGGGGAGRDGLGKGEEMVGGRNLYRRIEEKQETRGWRVTPTGICSTGH